jgi:sulfite reductase beta subunit-like hemoprotein
VGYALTRYGLTSEPDPVSGQMVACTGKQFCNLAVTETKGHAYRLIEALRRRNVQLHGINIRMSGCPSSRAMSYTLPLAFQAAVLAVSGALPAPEALAPRMLRYRGPTRP